MLEAILAMEPELEAGLDKVVAGPCFASADLPTPTPEQRKALGKVAVGGDQSDLFGGGEDEAESDD